jgi:hypothetical protein
VILSLALDELAVLELLPGSDEGPEVRAFKDPPTVLGGLDQPERHLDAGRRRARPLVGVVRCRTVARVDSMG